LAQDCHILYSRLFVVAHADPTDCTFERTGDSLVATTPRGRKWCWDQQAQEWLRPDQTAPESGTQQKMALEKELGIMTVLELEMADCAGNELRNYLMNMSPLVVTLAHRLRTMEVDLDRNQRDLDMVGLVTTEPLSKPDVRRWEQAVEKIVEETDEAN